MQDDGVLIRPMDSSEGPDGDLAYVFSTFLRDLRDADPSSLPADLWFAAHREYLLRTLADKRVVALVAAAADQPREILGYVIARPEEELVWVHVRRGPLRERGLAKMLLEQVKCGPTVPAAWMTRLGRSRLQNRLGSRRLRSEAGSKSTDSQSRRSTRSS